MHRELSSEPVMTQSSGLGGRGETQEGGGMSNYAKGRKRVSLDIYSLALSPCRDAMGWLDASTEGFCFWKMAPSV